MYVCMYVCILNFDWLYIIALYENENFDAFDEKINKNKIDCFFFS